MALVRLSATSAGATIIVNRTRYVVCGNAALLLETVEATTQRTFRSAGTLSDLYVYLSGNTFSTATLTIRSRVNGGNGNMVITVSAGVTGIAEDTSNTDTISAGDEVNYSMVSAAGGSGDAALRALASVFSASSGTVGVHSANNSYSVLEGVTSYVPLAGGAGLDSTESDTQYSITSGGTLQNMFVYLSTNTVSGNSNARSRVNSGNGNLLVTLTGSTTGIFEDTSNTDSLVDDDVVNYSLTCGTGGLGIVARLVSTEFYTTNDSSIFVAAHETPVSYAASNTRYCGVGGIVTSISTEALTHLTARMGTQVLENLRINVATNATTGGTTTFRMRQNTSNSNLSVVVTTATTGYFTDTSNTETLADDDEINYSITVGTGGAVTVLKMGMNLQAVAAAPVTYRRPHIYW